MFILVFVVKMLLILVLVVTKIYIKLTTGWCRSQVCLKGKTALVTGADSGLGFATALDFAKRGAKVILACIDETSAKKARDNIINQTHNDDVHYKLVDFTSLGYVRKFATELIASENRLDILVNNAGVLGLGNKQTEDGLQITMQVNYFAPFLLTNLLLELLKKSNGRIVNVSSMTAQYSSVDLSSINVYKGEARQYPLSKLCIILFTIELASRLKNTMVTTYSLHPGLVKTKILANASPLVRIMMKFIIDTFFKDSTEGAQTSIHLAVENGIENLSGQHFHDCKLVKRYKSANCPLVAKKLWEKTENMVQLH